MVRRSRTKYLLPTKLAEGFRIYQVNGGQTYKIDDITLVIGNFSSVPEPTSLLIFRETALVGLRRRRRISRILRVSAKAPAR